MNAIDKEFVKQTLGNISLVGIELSKYLFGKAALFQRNTVVCRRSGEFPFHDFPHVVDDDMEFETMVLSHGSFALLGCSQEDLVTMTSLDMTHLDGRRVDDGESCTFADTMNLLKQREFDGHHFLTFYEAVVR